jgi:hypothetical protein
VSIKRKLSFQDWDLGQMRRIMKLYFSSKYAMGQILLEKNIAESVESDVLSINNSPTGVYFLQIQTVENKIAVRKLILAR